MEFSLYFVVNMQAKWMFLLYIFVSISSTIRCSSTFHFSSRKVIFRVKQESSASRSLTSDGDLCSLTWIARLQLGRSNVTTSWHAAWLITWTRTRRITDVLKHQARSPPGNDHNAKLKRSMKQIAVIEIVEVTWKILLEFVSFYITDVITIRGTFTNIHINIC